MSLVYNVVIIDDQKGFYDDYKVIIGEHLSMQGYIAKVDYINSDLDFEKYELSKPDLFMVDLKFGHIDQGQEFIKKIRKDYYTDILFYSSDHEAIQKYRQSAEMQGIYFAEKDEQTSEVDDLLKGLLDKMILKSNSPRSTRGIVMECVSELDEAIRNKIAFLVKKIPTDDKKAVEREILKLFKESNDGKTKKLEDFFHIPFIKEKIPTSEFAPNYEPIDFESLIQDIQITDSTKNIRILCVIYKYLYGKTELYSNIKRYEELLGKRNILAHVTQEQSSNGFIFRNRSDESKNYNLTTEESVTLRKLIIEMENCISQIA